VGCPSEKNRTGEAPNDVSDKTGFVTSHVEGTRLGISSSPTNALSAVTIGPAVTIGARVKKVWEMLIGLAVVAVLSSGEKGKIAERTSFCLSGTASCVSAATGASA
jgi:hypothetical protein